MKKSLIFAVLFAFVLSFGVLTAFPAHASTNSTNSTSSTTTTKSSKHHHKEKHSKSKKSKKGKKGKSTDTGTGTEKSTNQGGSMFR